MRPVGLGRFEFGILGGEVPVHAFEGGELLGTVDAHGGLVGVVQRRKNLEVIHVGDRIKLVRVALRALERDPEHAFADGVHAVEHAFDAILLVDDGAFLVNHRVAQIAGRDAQVLRALEIALGRREEVAGDLVDDELVVRLVGVDGFDHPIAPRPLLPRQVFLVTVAVGVARGVEPVARPFLAVARRGEERFHEGGVGFVPVLGVGRDELIELPRRRRQADQIEPKAARQRLGGGFRRGLQARRGAPDRDEGVHGIFIVGPGGQGGTRRRDEPPMRLILRALGDPLAQRRDLRRRERCFLGLGRRHQIFGVVRRHDAEQQFALVGFARDDRGQSGLAARQRARAVIEAQTALARPFVLTVTRETTVGENRADVAVELNLRNGLLHLRRKWQGECGETKEGKTAHESWSFNGEKSAKSIPENRCVNSQAAEHSPAGFFAADPT